MLKSTDRTDRKEDKKAEDKAEARSRRRQEQASIVEGLRAILQADEQLLGFARGRIAGGWRGKLAVGPEAFFAPFVNVGLTEKRFILQHIHPENNRPSEILPHEFPLADISSLAFVEIETFGSDPAGRLTLRMNDEDHFRVRLVGEENCRDARALAEVLNSLVRAQNRGTSPTQRTCSACAQTLDRAYRFCPYCGTQQEEGASEAATTASPGQAARPTETAETTPMPTGVALVSPASFGVTSGSSSAATPATPPPVAEAPAAPAPPAAPEPPPLGPAGAFGASWRTQSFPTSVPPVPPAPAAADIPSPPEIPSAPAPPIADIVPPPVQETPPPPDMPAPKGEESAANAAETPEVAATQEDSTAFPKLAWSDAAPVETASAEENTAAMTESPVTATESLEPPSLSPEPFGETRPIALETDASETDSPAVHPWQGETRTDDRLS